MADVSRHGLSVDVEAWYHPELVRRRLPAGPLDPALGRALDPLLTLLRQRRARATFFVVGELLERCADTLRGLLERGHELGCHGWSHRPLWELGEAGLREELARFREAEARLRLGRAEGFRAPTFSLDGRTAWALPVLAEFGFRYDSSVFPARNPLYGVPGAPLGLYPLTGTFDRPPAGDLPRHDPAGPLWELPPTVCPVGPWRLPVAGGTYLRLLPFGLLRWCLRRVVQQGRPLVLYVHPWELSTSTPRVALPLLWRWVTYGGQAGALRRLDRLLQGYRFVPLGELVPYPWPPVGGLRR